MKKRFLACTVAAALAFFAVGCSPDMQRMDYSEGNNSLGTDQSTGVISMKYDKELFFSNLGTVQAADPSVITVGDTFYLYATNANSGLACNEIHAWSSKNLSDWTALGEAFVPARDAWAVNTLWAPEVIERAGKYYMYYSGYDLAKRRMCIGVAVASSPEGPFHELEGTFDGKTYSRKTCPFDFGFPVIDPSPFIDDDGSAYLYFSRDQYKKESSIFGCRLADDMVTVSDVTETPLLRPSQDWENYATSPRWNEAPFMLKHGGKYYLTYSANYYQSSTYAVGVAVATSPLGNFIKADYNPILEAHPDWTFISGTGHNSFFPSPDGSEIFIAYHSHIDTVNGGSERKINFDRVSFDGDRIVVCGPSVTPQPLPSGCGAGYKNLAPTAAVSASVSEGKERLNDGIINFRTDTADDYEYASCGENTITFTFAKPVRVRAIMIYDSAEHALAADKCEVSVGGFEWDMNFDSAFKFTDQYGYDVKIPGSAAISQFVDVETTEVTVTLDGDVNIGEIVILAKEVA